MAHDRDGDEDDKDPEVSYLNLEDAERARFKLNDRVQDIIAQLQGARSPQGDKKESEPYEVWARGARRAKNTLEREIRATNHWITNFKRARDMQMAKSSDIGENIVVVAETARNIIRKLREEVAGLELEKLELRRRLGLAS